MIRRQRQHRHPCLFSWSLAFLLWNPPLAHCPRAFPFSFLLIFRTFISFNHIVKKQKIPLRGFSALKYFLHAAAEHLSKFFCRELLVVVGNHKHRVVYATLLNFLCGHCHVHALSAHSVLHRNTLYTLNL